jgi:hypothetical protein
LIALCFDFEQPQVKLSNHGMFLILVRLVRKIVLFLPTSIHCDALGRRKSMIANPYDDIVVAGPRITTANSISTPKLLPFSASRFLGWMILTKCLFKIPNDSNWIVEYGHNTDTNQKTWTSQQ